ncbi:hypothetical protein ACWT_6143 [Actinoplanes sp. SE50]|uniref:hypothetical protein n=1 Tax=unclassified Actinoplanes TaxID=2626549 RepID=UPI00023ECD57|nr:MULTISPECIES: hypothetical protein [unclassified Actinoplanes]AEV87160.1 hypothetical protein ACPL_6275 [Actinoplanes sp. SE50/110]ATO85558.1 hypothetical protein ACWT_6143 [Actinoplanes sp. SE50]SLM02971.1 hypothetical protein ACSP50_6256 [Actinoplanes sp. SE50/110]
MEKIIVNHKHVAGADYSGQSIGQFSAQGSTFEDCRFDRSMLGQASFGSGTEQSYYVRCSFDRTSLTFLGGFARFVGRTFTTPALKLLTRSAESMFVSVAG